MLYDKSTGTSYSGYSEPAFGYLYYSCPSGQDKTCASEWADVEKNIATGTDMCIGLGDQSTATGSLRTPNAIPGSPDAYPIAMGVLTGYTPCKVLETFLLGQLDGGTGGAGGTGGSGAGGSSAGGSTSTGGAAGSGSGGAAGNAGAAGSTSSGGASTGGASSGGAASGGASAGGAASGGKSGAGDTSEDDGGCSVSGSGGGSSAVWALAALGAAFALGRRRRS
jgi:MYXO-CTERM domain-containing protein